MNGCKKCPAYAKCTETYRGSGCAALRYTYGLESDPKLDCADREKLIALLNDVGSNVLQFPTDGFITALADHLLANGVTFAKDMNVLSKWISVEERLPEDLFDFYLIALKEKYPYEENWRHHVDIAKLEFEGCGYLDGRWDTYNDWDEGQEIHVTHWMPLPEPPKEV